jgi:hypothetical protein
MNAASCRRTRPRAAIARPSTLRTIDAEPVDVTVEDLSASGFCFSNVISIPAGTHVRIGLAGGGRADAEITWQKGTRHGCVFTPPLTPAQSETAFTHELGGPAIITVLANTDASAQLASEMGRQRAFPVNFALTVLAGGLCWAMLVVLLRGLNL